MVRPKAKKQPSRGVDFKKIKRKVGRKLPPPNNTTNTEIKSKAIILPEQSVASDKVGLAVSKKGLTLKELLQQTSHHNVKVRKDALLGIKELLLKYQTELKLHKLAIIEKLRERISDDDKVVRETLYQLFKSVILPGCKEDNQGALISLVMAYILNAMTHLSIDVRLMAFKFFDLVVQNYPPAFSSNAEKVLENFMDILQKNQFHLEDKGKFKIALSGLVRCLQLLPNEKEVNSSKQDKAEKQLLHAFDPDVPRDSTGMGRVPIIMKLMNLVPVLVNCFDGLISAVNSQPTLDSQSFDCMLSILQSIDLVVQYFVSGVGKYQEDGLTSSTSLGSLDICLQDKKFHPFLLDKVFAGFPMQPLHHLSEKDDHRYFILNAVISQIFFTYSQWICSPLAMLDRFLKFVVDELFKIYGGELSDRAFYEKHLLSLVPYIPKLISRVDWNWKRPLLQAFTVAFGHCYPDSTMKMACLKAVEEMLLSKQLILYTDAGEEEPLDHQRTWINEIVLLLNSLGNRKPAHSNAVLHLQLRLGQIGLSNITLAEEYDKIQDELQKYYCICTETGHVCYGPFMELPLDSQEISICCLYYFSSLKQPLLASLALCCLSHSLEPFILFRIIEVINSAYRAGRIQIADYVSFFITLLSQYEAIPVRMYSDLAKDGAVSNQVTFRSVTGAICSFLSQMGDQSLVFEILEHIVLDLTSSKLPLDNTCALMRMLTTVDITPTRLSEKSIIVLSDILLSYLIDVALLLPEHEEEGTNSDSTCMWRYYLLPCFILMDRSTTLVKYLIDKMGSATAESCELPFLRDTQVEQDRLRRIKAIVTVISLIYKDFKMQKALLSCKAKIDGLLQRILLIQSSMVGKMSIEEQHKAQRTVERLKNAISEISNMAS